MTIFYAIKCDGGSLWHEVIILWNENNKTSTLVIWEVSIPSCYGFDPWHTLKINENNKCKCK
jgi:hypothetical protein